MYRARVGPIVVVATIGAVLGLAGPTSASNWSIGLTSSSSAQATAQALPAAPAIVIATCTSPTLTTIKVSWTPVTRATNYTVLRSTTSSTGGYSTVATVTTTTWTSGSLSNGNYWFEIVANIGSNWKSAASSATAKRTISAGSCA